MPNNKKLLSLYLRLWSHLSKASRVRVILLVFAHAGSSVLEYLSIGAIVPFLAVLTSPNEAELTKAMPFASLNIFNAELESPLVLWSWILIATTLIAATFRLFVYICQIYVVNSISAEISQKVFSTVLSSPYESFVLQDHSEIISAITNKVNSVSNSVISPLISAASSTIILSAILYAIISVSSYASLLVCIFFVSIYFLISVVSRKKVALAGSIFNDYSTRVISTLRDSLGGIRDVIINDSSDFYIRRFGQAITKLQSANTYIQSVSGAPRIALEAIAIVALVIVANVTNVVSVYDESVIPKLGLFALAAQRALPYLNQIYWCKTVITGTLPTLSEVLRFLDPGSKSASPSHPDLLQNTDKLIFKTAIEFRNIGFSYMTADQPVISGMSWKIQKGAVVGIVGDSGSGKSTLLDILSGLLTPSFGEVLIDDVVLSSSNLREWQRMISYVSQSIHITNKTFLENIAFGVALNEVDMERAMEAAKISKIDEFILSTTSGYFTTLGEGGTYLSGGQRQRIGIARALYKESSLLILDEATNALDENLEREFFVTLRQIRPRLTVILVTHRLSSLNVCDAIIKLGDESTRYTPRA